MQKEIGEYNRKPERRLTVGAEVCSQLLPSILQSFHCQQPDAHIQVISAYPLDLVKDDLDFLLKAGSAAEKDFLGKSEQLLLQEEILLALPREHPLERYFEEKGLRKPLRTTEVNNSFLQCEFVSKGLGISLIPAKSWNYVYENRSIVLKNIKNWDLKRIVYLSSNPDRYQTELSKSFRQFLTAYFTELGTTGYEKCI
ncbi:MAG TPA: substrate-binding domain-containing protein [Candidatus Mediterraneibacter stercoripullorum]|nr:substrate-binding domain-containing protein [Candidatus Mediterraneibacter stercoripullorum]